MVEPRLVCLNDASRATTVTDRVSRLATANEKSRLLQLLAGNLRRRPDAAARDERVRGCRRGDSRRRLFGAVDRLLSAAAATVAEDRDRGEGDRGLRCLGAQWLLVHLPFSREPRAYRRAPWAGLGARTVPGDGRRGRR